MSHGVVASGSDESAEDAATPSSRRAWESAQPAERRSDGPRAGLIERLFGVDVRALAALRVALALFLLLDLATRSTDLADHFSDYGILPRAARITAFDLQAASSTRMGWSLHLMNGTAEYQAALFVLAALFALALLVGYRTRLATFVSWALLVSLQMRLPVVLQGGDTLLRMLLFWSLFLPLGAAWSVDRYLHAVRRSPSSARPVITSPATAVLLLQVGVMYFFNAAAKSDPVWHPRYEAAYYALSFDLYVKPIGRALLAYPRLLTLLTMATWWLEWLGPLLAFLPRGTRSVRIVLVATFWTFHLGLAMCLELGLLPYIAVAAWLPFLPSAVWDRSERVFSKIAGRRLRRLAEWLRLAGWLRYPSRPDWRLGRVGGLVCCLLFGYVLVHCAAEALKIPLAAPWYPVAEALRLDQHWTMFAPRPVVRDGWFVVRGQLVDGTEVNAWQPARPLPWQEPRLASREFPNHRWRKYWSGFCEDRNQELLSCLSDWLRWRWDKDYAGRRAERRLRTIEIYFLADPTPSPNARTADRGRPERELIWSWDYRPEEVDEQQRPIGGDNRVVPPQSTSDEARPNPPTQQLATGPDL